MPNSKARRVALAEQEAQGLGEVRSLCADGPGVRGIGHPAGHPLGVAPGVVPARVSLDLARS